MMSGPLVNGSSQTAAPFQFPFIVLLRHGRGAIFNLQPSSPPSTSILVATSSLFNLNPPCQLHPSSPPTSTLVAIQFQTPSLCYFLPFSLMMPAVFLMLLLPNELLTKIIIHSIKDEPIFHFLNLRNKICSTSQHIYNSDEVLLHVSLRDLRDACRNRYVRSCFERRFCEANHLEELCFEGMEKLMRRRNPDKGLKLIRDAAAEDSGAKYFLAMLKYRCNLMDPAAMALLQEISSGPSPPDGRWKNPNLRQQCYLVKQDLDNITWWYWLDDGDEPPPPTFHCCPSRIPTSAFGKRDVGAMGRIQKRSSTTAAPSVASVMSSTSRRVASASPWSTPSAG
jgi:hypothetical protein